MATNLYHKYDLGDYATTPTNSGNCSRSDLLKAMLPDKADIDTVSTGGYQGHLGFIIRLDGFTWVLKDAYGSCEYCDGLLGADDAASYGQSMMRNAYCFDSNDDAATFVRQQDGWGWDSLADDLLDTLKDSAETAGESR